MNRFHPNDRPVRVEIWVTLGDNRRGVVSIGIDELERWIGADSSFVKDRLFEALKLAEHTANPKGPRLPPELERCPV